MSKSNGHVRGAGESRSTMQSGQQRKLLALMAKVGEPISTTDLANIMGSSIGATAHHVRALVRLKVLTWAGERRARGALQTFYIVNEDGRETLNWATAELVVDVFGAVTRRKGSKDVLVFPRRLDAQAVADLNKYVEDLHGGYAAIIARLLDRQEAARQEAAQQAA